MKFPPLPCLSAVRRDRSCGFTLLELLFTVAVLAILLALGVPSFARLLATNRMSTQTNEFIAAVNLARVEAVRRVQPISLSSDAGTLEYAAGWSIFTDSSADGAKGSTDADGVVLRVGGTLSGRTTIKRVTAALAESTTSDKNFLNFNERGALKPGTATAFFRVCDSGNTAIPGRIIQVTLIGKATVVNTAAACS